MEDFQFCIKNYSEEKLDEQELEDKKISVRNGQEYKPFRMSVYHKSKLIAYIAGEPYSSLCNLEVINHEYKRKGLGTKLLQSYIDHVIENTNLKEFKFLSSFRNVKAISLYSKMGFTFEKTNCDQVYCILPIKR